jgi:NADH dehydrogenase/NADH:ubiquinone oxidoreductase subunit G
MIKLTVNNSEIEVKEGMNLLEACLDNNIYIPNLCFIKGKERISASCRLCFVEVEGEDKPIPSCTMEVRDGMVVKTDTQAVRRLQRSALRLLLSVHKVDCAKCPANKRCDLQKLAIILNVGLKTESLDEYLKETEVDETHPVLNYFPNRCVLCGRCVYVCKEKHDRPLLTFTKRGLDTVISLYGGEDSGGPACKDCLACVDVCPVAAIIPKKIP